MLEKITNYIESNIGNFDDIIDTILQNTQDLTKQFIAYSERQLSNPQIKIKQKVNLIRVLDECLRAEDELILQEINKTLRSPLFKIYRLQNSQEPLKTSFQKNIDEEMLEFQHILSKVVYFLELHPRLNFQKSVSPQSQALGISDAQKLLESLGVESRPSIYIDSNYEMNQEPNKPIFKIEDFEEFHECDQEIDLFAYKDKIPQEKGYLEDSVMTFRPYMITSTVIDIPISKVDQESQTDQLDIKKQRVFGTNKDINIIEEQEDIMQLKLEIQVWKEKYNIQVTNNKRLSSTNKTLLQDQEQLLQMLKEAQKQVCQLEIQLKKK